MVTIIQQPDALSLSKNLKKFIISSDAAILVQLSVGATEIFDVSYAPGIGGLIEIDLRNIIDKLVTIGIPANNDVLTEQVLGVADFTLTIDGTDVDFRAIKGGVAELQSQAHDFVDANLLSWQPQDKRILQYAPEWIGIYATAERKIMVKAYYLDETTETILLATAAIDKLWSVNVGWYAVNGALTKKDPVAWDVWMEDSVETQLSYIQRYRLRNAGDEENLYLWCNTLGGIDSVSFSGYLEDDKKLEHKISKLVDESLDEYWTDKNREIKQSTGYLTTEESRWLEDFFISPVRYRVRPDGAIKRIVLIESKVISSTADDQYDYEFTYRYSDDPALLNLYRTLDPLPAPEGLADFFLTELLSGLTTALYQDNLYLAIQSPFAQGWQKLSFAQLWEQALPKLVDNNTIVFFDGKLRTNAGVVIQGRKPKHGFEAAADAILSFNAATLEFTITEGIEIEGVLQDIRLWNMGELLKKNEETIAVELTQGTWYIYYKDIVQQDMSIASTLMATMDSWNRNLDLPVATLVYDGLTWVLTDNRYVYTEVNHSPLTRYEDRPHPALDIYTNTSKFLNLLTIAEKTVQKALDKIDYLMKVTVIPFENSSAPSIENYEDDYAPRYGQHPTLRLIVFEGDNELPLYQAPIIYKAAGRITRIAWFLAETAFSGKILISR